jgi:hypothetical protein
VFACKNSRTAERIFVKFDIKEVYWFFFILSNFC